MQNLANMLMQCLAAPVLSAITSASASASGAQVAPQCLSIQVQFHCQGVPQPVNVIRLLTHRGIGPEVGFVSEVVCQDGRIVENPVGHIVGRQDERGEDVAAITAAGLLAGSRAAELRP